MTEKGSRNWGEMAVKLTPEEEKILDEHPVEDLGQLTAQAEEDYLRATGAERAEAYRRYLMILNLGAKVLTYERPDPPPELLRAQRTYLDRVRAARRRGKPLSESEQGKFKASIFAAEIKREQANFKYSGDRL